MSTQGERVELGEPTVALTFLLILPEALLFCSVSFWGAESDHEVVAKLILCFQAQSGHRLVVTGAPGA